MPVRMPSPKVLVFGDEHRKDDHKSDAGEDASRDERPPGFLPAEVNDEERQGEQEHPDRTRHIPAEEHGEQREGPE